MSTQTLAFRLACFITRLTTMCTGPNASLDMPAKQIRLGDSKWKASLKPSERALAKEENRNPASVMASREFQRRTEEIWPE